MNACSLFIFVSLFNTVVWYLVFISPRNTRLHNSIQQKQSCCQKRTGGTISINLCSCSLYILFWLKTWHQWHWPEGYFADWQEQLSSTVLLSNNITPALLFICCHWRVIFISSLQASCTKLLDHFPKYSIFLAQRYF